MIKFSVSILIFLFSISIYAQTMLSGIVNVYSGLLGQDECANTIDIENAPDFVEGMGILIIQINGATIQTSNNESFGNITNLNGAGQYEYNKISQITGQTITLEHTLQNTYLAANSQVIGFEIVENAIISGEVTAPAWNGHTGGIIVIEAENSIQVQANIIADGLGFRGGLSYVASDDNCNAFTNSNNFSYGSGNWRGAPKGEGIAAFVNGSENGRGPQANGGGGGNSHNSGGGGGALLTQGGSGGDNDEPSFLGCDGKFPGRGGKIVPNDLSKIFFGGGGGSGHSNNNIETRGGAGGGIIILKSDEITFRNGSLSANGLNGDTVSGDGGGGGGAAGSILLDVPTINGAIIINATGGNGGDTNNFNQGRCFGPGGGGSGGLLLSNQALTAQLDGGLSGQIMNSTACSGSSGASAGMTGILNTNFTSLIQGEEYIIPSILFTSPDTIICASEPLILSNTLLGENLNYQWQVLINETWTDLVEGASYSGTQSPDISFTTGLDQAVFYRLLITPDNDCLDAIISPEIEVVVIPPPSISPSFTLDGFEVQFMANADHFNSLNWMFTDTEMSSEINPNFSFTTTGNHEVILTATSDCGETTSTLNIEITAPISAQITSTTLSGCAPLNILFSDESIGQIDERIWTFEGGNPATSTDANPLVEFAEVGVFEVSLTVQNSGTSSTSTTSISVLNAPIPNFSFETDGLSVVFTNNSSNADSYLWNFGDGNMSTQDSPLHTYTTSGTYQISLNAINDFCGTAISQDIGVHITNVSDIDSKKIKVYPNPGNGLYFLETNMQGQFEVFDINGRITLHKKTISTLNTIDISKHPSGLYFLLIESDGQIFRTRLVKL